MLLLSPVRIKARLAAKLNNLTFRRRFFRLRAQEETAQHIRELRERRKLRQVDLAKRAGMKQSAVSRIEQASYSAWSYKTLLRIAEALDAQLRIIFEASEDVIARYQHGESEPAVGIVAASTLGEFGPFQPSGAQVLKPQVGQSFLVDFGNQFGSSGTGATDYLNQSGIVTRGTSYGIEGSTTGTGNAISAAERCLWLSAESGGRSPREIPFSRGS